jgi:hypothetical protein
MCATAKCPNHWETKKMRAELCKPLATNMWCAELRLDCFYLVGFIGDKGAEALAHALGQNNHLQRLNLRGNRIGDPGATALGLCRPCVLLFVSFSRWAFTMFCRCELWEPVMENLMIYLHAGIMLRKNRTLRQLNLDGNKITKQACFHDTTFEHTAWC